ncbi:hypothetical protein [Natrinema gelatinilyticum]|uniref:hypothetical protein n=1 Tax=Natrinema gelatinilyticum TaxID=2961571 RepID=UPI0020C40FA8|nr:hypothetical protein [Natrinema gelatinilyticum]
MTSNSPDNDASIHKRLAQLEARVNDLESENDTLQETVSEQCVPTKLADLETRGEPVELSCGQCRGDDR